MCLSVTQAASAPGGGPSSGPSSSMFGKPGGGIEITMGTKDVKLPVVLKVSLPLFLFLCRLLLICLVLFLCLLPPPHHPPPPSVSFHYSTATWQSEWQSEWQVHGLPIAVTDIQITSSWIVVNSVLATHVMLTGHYTEVTRHFCYIFSTFLYKMTLRVVN